MVCLVPVLRICVWYVFCYNKEEGSSPVALQLLYEVPFSMSLLGFGMGTMLANFISALTSGLCKMPYANPQRHSTTSSSMLGASHQWFLCQS